MGTLNKDLAVGFTEDVKKNLIEVDAHITSEMSEEIDNSGTDDQGKINMDELEAKMHEESIDGEKLRAE